MALAPLPFSTRGSALCCAAMIGCMAPVSIAAQQPLVELRPALEERVARHQGEVGLAIIDLATGDTLSLRGDDPFPTASTIKVPVLVEVYHQVARGRLGLQDPLVVLGIDQVPGSGVLRFLTAPHHLTVRDAAFLMVAFSDNTATNLLLDKVGLRAVGVRMDSLGLHRTRIHSRVFDRASSIAPDSSVRYGLGVTTPNEFARLLAMLYRGEVVSPDASREMLGLLRHQFYSEAMPRHLPPGTSVAHKTGSVSAARSDCGIIYTPGRDIVLCVLTAQNQDTSWRIDNEAQLLIADLARMVHAHLAAPRT
jgi:beta-lactamase class A